MVCRRGCVGASTSTDTILLVSLQVCKLAGTCMVRGARRTDRHYMWVALSRVSQDTGYEKKKISWDACVMLDLPTSSPCPMPLASLVVIIHSELSSASEEALFTISEFQHLQHINQFNAWSIRNATMSYDGNDKGENCQTVS